MVAFMVPVRPAGSMRKQTKKNVSAATGSAVRRDIITRVTNLPIGVEKLSALTRGPF